MEINCKAIKLSIEITIISLMLLINFQILDIKTNHMIIDILIQIDLGIFSSSVITIFFYTSAYKIEKRKLLENYWNEIRKILINFEKVEYMDIGFKEDVIVGYLHERSNVWMQQYNKMNPKNVILEDLKNTDIIKVAIKKENKEIMEQLSKEGQKQFLNEKLEKIYYNTVKKIDKISGQYLEFLDYGIEELNRILGDMEFFTGEENYFKSYKLYRNIYELRLKIRNSARHFRYYKERKGNKSIVLFEILELQKDIFKEVQFDRETKEELYDPKDVISLIHIGTQIYGFDLSQEKIEEVIKDLKGKNGAEKVDQIIAQYKDKIKNADKQNEKDDYSISTREIGTATMGIATGSKKTGQKILRADAQQDLSIQQG